MEKTLAALYGEDNLSKAKFRYKGLIDGLETKGREENASVRLFSVPGRTELGGNHTDHNHGKVLAASIQLDAAAAVVKRGDNKVFFRSTGHKDVEVDLSTLSIKKEEYGTTHALIRGIAAEMTAQGTPLGGFNANCDNQVLSGSGLSSSAAIEVLIAKIFDALYCGGKRSSLELAKIGQKAENIYFNKPCGLMDQCTCATGGTIAIDFSNKEKPLIKNIKQNLDDDYTLCILATGSSHANLTSDYAEIPKEMKAVAEYFGKSVLREVDEKLFFSKITELRKSTGERALLRAIHFFNENRRVDAMLSNLKNQNIEDYLSLVNESGDSSWQLLQNVYSAKQANEQSLALAIALTKNFLKNDGACRVHGGGFAGTIQAYIPRAKLDSYKKLMENIYGKGSLTVLKIRSVGAIEIK